MEQSATESGFSAIVTGEALRSLDGSITSIWRIKLLGLTAFLLLPTLFYDLTHLFSPNSWLPFGVLSGTVLGLGVGMVAAGAGRAVWQVVFAIDIVGEVIAAPEGYGLVVPPAVAVGAAGVILLALGGTGRALEGNATGA